VVIRGEWRLEPALIVKRRRLEDARGRLSAGLLAPESKEAAGDVRDVVHVVNDLPLAQSSVTRQRNRARANPSERHRDGAKLLAPVNDAVGAARRRRNGQG